MTIPANESSSSATLTRRDFMGAAGVALVGASLAFANPSSGQAQVARGGTIPTPGKQPNIILLITDQERYPRHWPATWAAENLPAHNRLMANGLTFRRFFCNAAMCSPSRATLFTGLHPAQHGVTRTLTVGGTESPEEPPLPLDFQTMGHLLASAGYHVAYRGKFHLTKHADGTEPTTEDAAALGFLGWEATTMANDAAVENFAGGCADWDRITTDQAITFLGTQSEETTAQQPFALIVGLGNPHDVLAYPKTWDAIDEETGCDNYTGFDFDLGIELPPTVHEDLSTKPTSQAQSLLVYAAGLGPVPTPQQKLDYVNFYAGLIKEVDVQVERILDAIPAELRDDTIVIYTSDHGEMGMSHGGLRQKMFNIYEETVNIPLIIHNPKLFPAPQTTDAYGSLIDLMPTLASFASITDQRGWFFHGRDLTPIVEEPTTTVQSEILFTFDDDQIGQINGIPNTPQGDPLVAYPYYIRCIIAHDPDGEWKYARYFDPTGVEPEQYEMYHLYDGEGQPVDPNEETNLAHATRARSLSTFYGDKRAELAQRLALLEAERLQPLSHYYLPVIQKS
ncbi:MAG: sulfatase-like hydrolase/transferase [Caldilineaceae bacterium]|nr:sulfatase-like hydrolase/transferase [Caldilineaceae bacterium]